MVDDVHKEQPRVYHDFEIMEDNRLTLEQVMSMFYQFSLFDNSYDSRIPGVVQNRLGTLVGLVAYTLMVAQKGPVCKKHLAISKVLRKGDILISYNYDTILDNALRNAGKFTDSGYHIDFHRVFARSKWGIAESSPSQVLLLKLHGSLNWLRCKRCKSNFLYRKQVDIQTRYQTWEYMNSSCPRCGEKTLETVIMPPLIGKNYQEVGLDYLWSVADEVINTNSKKIDEIIIIGYRLPDADIASMALFRRANRYMMSSNPNYRLTIVNPDMTAVDHFKRIFSTSNVRHFKSMMGFLDSI